MQAVDATVTIDIRERCLIRTFHEQGASGQIIRSLPLGDVQCTYADGTGWLLERKTALDFAASICDGRYFEQRSRLYNEKGVQVVFVIEGDLRQSMMHATMLSAMVGVGRSERAQIYRTWDLQESCSLICVLVRKLQLPSPIAHVIPSGIVPPKMMTSKRQRDAAPDTVFKRMLMCIPSISENISDRLVKEFVSLSNLQHALGNETPFRQILLQHGKLGKIRVQRLKYYLVGVSV